jgi:hypothetical protein
MLGQPDAQIAAAAEQLLGMRARRPVPRMLAAAVAAAAHGERVFPGRHVPLELGLGRGQLRVQAFGRQVPAFFPEAGAATSACASCRRHRASCTRWQVGHVPTWRVWPQGDCGVSLARFLFDGVIGVAPPGFGATMGLYVAGSCNGVASRPTRRRSLNGRRGGGGAVRASWRYPHRPPRGGPLDRHEEGAARSRGVSAGGARRHRVPRGYL